MENQYQSSPHRPHQKISFTQTFQSSEGERQAKFSLDRSLAKGIMQNNSSFIVEQQKLRTNPTSEKQPDIDQQTQKLAINLRNKYDKIKTKNNAIEVKIAKMKEQLQIYKEKQKNYKEKNDGICQKYKKTEEELDQINQNLEELTLRMDANRSMEDRLKKDIIFYKKNIFDLNLELQKKKNQVRRLGNSSQRQKKLSLRCNTLLSSVQKNVNKNKMQRNRGLESTDKAIGRRRQYVFRQLERSHHIQRSMEEAIMMKLPEERQLISIFHTHIFLKRVLHTKMESVMQKNKVVGDSFTTIKQETTIKTAQQFVHNYLNRDQIYGDLLQAISKAEPVIEGLKEENEKEKVLQSQLEYSQDQLEERLNLFHEKEEGDALKKLEKLDETIKCHDEIKNKLTLWAVDFISMFRGVSRKHVRKQYSQLTSLIKDSLKIMLKAADIEEENEKSISEKVLEKQTQNNRIEAKDLLLRNIRIKTLGAEALRPQEEYDDGKTEKQFLQMSRRAVKRKNIPKMRLVKY